MAHSLEELLQVPTLDDLVALVLAKSNLDRISSNKAALHGFFKELKDRDSQPAQIQEILDDLVFEEGDFFPFSRDLEGAIMRLQISGLVSAMNPGFRKYSMNETQRAAAEKRLSSFASESQAAIDATARAFASGLEATHA